MRLQSKAKLCLISILCSALMLTGCEKKPPPPDTEGSTLNPICSTLTGQITGNCTIKGDDDGPQTLNYTLISSRETVIIPVENGTKPAIIMHDAMVYNKTLMPERIEVGREDELRVKYQNEITLPSDSTRFDDLVGNAEGMKPWFSNLHTHGLVTAWDFKDSPDVRGDNVLDVLLSSKRQGLPPGIGPEDLCSTTGDNTSYSYPIRADHEIGLNWYHPHPHGVTGFQVEGGMSGLLMVGDAEAEKLLNPVYLQLKDMQAGKLADNEYRFEKFEPPVSAACHSKGQEEGWVFDNDAPGRCNYHADKPAADTPTDYSWLFLVNGELFPTIKLPESAYLRIANSSANATYRLVLEPDAVEKQKIDTTHSYYTPAFKVVEKDGMTTTEIAKTNKLNACTIAMTPATRVGVALNFADIVDNGRVCELKVTIKKETDGKISTFYDVQHKKLDGVIKKAITKQGKFATYTLTQEGIDTGEDDWPAVQLATLSPIKKLPSSNLAAYQNMLQEHDKNITITERTDVKLPNDSCKPTPSIADTDGINRHLALFFGGTKDTAGELIEHFGLVAAGEDNMGTAVSANTIRSWRTEYQNQFAGLTEPSSTYGPNGQQIPVQAYGVTDLTNPKLAGLVDHKFHVNKDGSVKASICTETSEDPKRWRIHNLSAQIHNFHIHQMKFKVANVRGSTCMRPPTKAGTSTFSAFKLAEKKTGYLKNNVTTKMLTGAMDEQCVKSYAELFHNVPASFKLTASAPLPPSTTTPSTVTPPTLEVSKTTGKDYGMHDTFPIPPMGYIDIDLQLNKAENVGEYVFHCHILEHEDAGMMGKLVVHPRS